MREAAAEASVVLHGALEAVDADLDARAAATGVTRLPATALVHRRALHVRRADPLQPRLCALVQLRLQSGANRPADDVVGKAAGGRAPGFHSRQRAPHSRSDLQPCAHDKVSRRRGLRILWHRCAAAPGHSKHGGHLADDGQVAAARPRLVRAQGCHRVAATRALPLEQRVRAAAVDQAPSPAARRMPADAATRDARRSWSFGTSKQHAPLAPTLSPGAGAYDIHSRVTSTGTASRPAYSFGNETRRSMASRERTPGPGSYHTRSSIGLQIESTTRTNPVSAFGAGGGGGGGGRDMVVEKASPVSAGPAASPRAPGALALAHDGPFLPPRAPRAPRAPLPPCPLTARALATPLPISRVKWRVALRARRAQSTARAARCLSSRSRACARHRRLASRARSASRSGQLTRRQAPQGQGTT